MMQLKRIVVTGASRGIGRAIAERLADEGRTIFIHGRDDKALNEVSEKITSMGAEAIKLRYEFASVDQLKSMVARIGNEPIDALIHNAGIAIVKPVDQLSLEDWNRTIGINITAPFLLTQGLLPLLTKGSSIVHIMSVAARTAFPNWSSYCMSKFAMEGFSMALREELREKGVRVINIYPAATSTGMWDSVEGDFPRENMMSPSQTADAVAFALERPSSVLVENISLGSLGGNL
jgi:3-oxoacyl-[acyl-carrier protein] reductase